MASSKEYLEFILGQLSELEEITYRAMMGEFIIYYRGKIVGGIYDDRLLVKPVKSAISYMPTALYELPYEGAKEMLLVDEVDNKEFLTGLFHAMYDELPALKPKKKRNKQFPVWRIKKIGILEVIMAFDFKKEYKEFYMPKNKPEIVNVPKANYIAVRGKGNPNEEGGAYQQAISVLYAVAYTLKMSYKTDYKIEGFFEYVVPPLEGFWWQDDVESVDYTNKSAFSWISVIRLPDFISKADFDWAVETATKKKKLDCSSAEYLTIDEGLCVQIMHIGSFDNEPATVALMDTYLEQNGYVNDINKDRLHHEIYMSDARKVAPEKWKTVIRHPIKKA